MIIMKFTIILIDKNNYDHSIKSQINYMKN